MNNSASGQERFTDLEHHRALNLENVKSELISGREELSKLRERDPREVDPEVAERLEKALSELERIISSSENRS
jgi:hypothetical protein